MIDFEADNLEKLTISKLKKVADYWLRKVLLKEAKTKNGLYFCPIKNKYYPESKIQVAHFIDRGYSMWTRYNRVNCNLISESSNVWDSRIMVEGFKSKHHKEYEDFLIEKFGEDVIEYLKTLASKKELMYKEDYIKIIKDLKYEYTSV